MIPSVDTFIRQSDGAVMVRTNNGYMPLSELTPVDSSVLPVGGNNTVIAATFTRPGDTTAYAAKDVVSNSTSAPTLLSWVVGRINAGSGYIVKARLMTDLSTDVKRYRLHLYHTVPTAINDNAQFTELYANASKRIGYIDFDALATEGTGSTAASALNKDIRLFFKCAAASQKLYGILETLDAGTPGNAQNYFIELSTENN